MSIIIKSETQETIDLKHRIEVLESVLAERERELLELKGACSGAAGQPYRLHYAHSGPCDTRESR